MKTISSILLFLDGALYDLIAYIYDIFLGLAKLNLFNNAEYEQIVSRIYVILGMVMLFFLAYSLLKAVINPDEFSKGEMSAPKLVKNVIVSLIIIAVLPAVFTYAFNIQNTILNNNTITKIVLGTDENAETVKESAGREMAYYFFRAFLYPEPDFCRANNRDENNCDDLINGNGAWFVTNGDSLEVQSQEVLAGNSFRQFSDFSEAVSDGDLHYTFIISTLGAMFIVYVLANFCFDLALRVIKLMFYQIIAPIAVICRVIPTGKLKDVFNNWVKVTAATFFEVFVRIAIMTFGVYMVHIVVGESFRDKIAAVGLTGFRGFIALALIIMGLVMFIKNAPKLIGEIFGTGNLKLGLREKLAEGGAFTAGAALGGAGGMLYRNAVHGVKNNISDIRAARARGERGIVAGAGSILRGIGSTVAGTVSGGIRSGFNARNAKNGADARNAMHSGVQTATTNRTNRERYAAQHQNDTHNNGIISGIQGAIGQIPIIGDGINRAANIGMAHITDRVQDNLEWGGIGNNLDALNAQRKFNEQIIAIDDNSDSVATDLMNRDIITTSSSIMTSVDMNKVTGGKRTYAHSLAAMRETLKNLENSTFDSLQGQTMDYLDTNKGNMTINTREDYAEYMAQMRAQLGQAERDMKKYLKTKGYEGQKGITDIETTIGANLGSGELQRMAKLQSDQENIANLIDANQNSVNGLNSSLPAGTKTVTSVSNYDDMDVITNNAKQRNIDINASIARMTREREARHQNDNNGGNH